MIQLFVHHDLVAQTLVEEKTTQTLAYGRNFEIAKRIWSDLSELQTEQLQILLYCHKLSVAAGDLIFLDRGGIRVEPLPKFCDAPAAFKGMLQKVKTLTRGDHMETGHELFVPGLNDLMYAECQLVAALEENANDSSRAELKLRLNSIAKIPKARLRGLIAEKKAFTEKDPSEDLIDVFDVGAPIKSRTG